MPRPLPENPAAGPRPRPARVASPVPPSGQRDSPPSRIPSTPRATESRRQRGAGLAEGPGRVRGPNPGAESVGRVAFRCSFSRTTRIVGSRRRGGHANACAVPNDQPCCRNTCFHSHVPSWGRVHAHDVRPLSHTSIHTGVHGRDATRGFGVRPLSQPHVRTSIPIAATSLDRVPGDACRQASPHCDHQDVLHR